jgi:glycosyltransferase involved in cell wall biosynthesis
MQSARELLRRGHRVSVCTPINGDATYPVGTIIPLRAPRRGDLNVFQRVLSRLACRVNHWVWPYYDHYLHSLIKQLEKLDSRPDTIISFNDLIVSRHLRAHFPQCQLFVNLQNEVRLSRHDTPKLFDSVDRILACSRHIRDWTAVEYHQSEAKFSVLLSGVDLEAFFPREDYLEGKSSLRVLFVGRIDRNKGPDIAADAVALLQREGWSVEFTVAGGIWFYETGKESEDPYFRVLKEKMDAIGARYLGHVGRNQIGDVFRDHDVVCVLSRSTEPFGLVVLEAMASGCAVIASNRGGIPDACGPAGVMVDPNDFAAVTQILRQYCCNPEILAEAKRRCRAYALSCSWASRVDELTAILPPPVVS